MFKHILSAGLALAALINAQSSTTRTSTTAAVTTPRTTTTSAQTGPYAQYAYGAVLGYLMSIQTADPAYSAAQAALDADEAIPFYTRLSYEVALPELALFTGTKVDAEVSSILAQLPSPIAAVEKSVIDKAHSIDAYYQTGTTLLPGIGLGLYNGVVATGAAASIDSALQDASISSYLYSLTASLSNTATVTNPAALISSTRAASVGSGMTTSVTPTASPTSASATRNAAAGSGPDTWIAGLLAGGFGLGVALL